jgi:hypothetical protein
MLQHASCVETWTESGQVHEAVTEGRSGFQDGELKQGRDDKMTLSIVGLLQIAANHSIARKSIFVLYELAL